MRMRLAHRNAIGTLDHWFVTRADAEPDAAGSQIIQRNRLRCKRDWVARIGWNYGGAKHDPLGRCARSCERGHGIGGWAAHRRPGSANAALFRLLNPGHKIVRSTPWNRQTCIE